MNSIKGKEVSKNREEISEPSPHQPPQESISSPPHLTANNNGNGIQVPGAIPETGDDKLGKEVKKEDGGLIKAIDASHFSSPPHPPPTNHGGNRDHDVDPPPQSHHPPEDSPTRSERPSRKDARRKELDAWVPPPQVHSSPGAIPIENDEEMGTGDGPATIEDASSTPVVVAASVVDQEENIRLVNKIEELQAQLRVHEKQDVVQAIPVADDGGKRNGDNDPVSSDEEEEAKQRRRRRIWMFVAVSIVAAIIAVVIAVTSTSSSSSSSGGDSYTTKEPTESPTSMPSSMPSTEQPTLHPTTVAPTVAPTQPPTVSQRTFLLQQLLSVSSFGTTEQWDIHLMDNAQSPQAQAVDWLLNQDQYASPPDSISTQELHERYALIVFYFATSGSDWVPLFDMTYLDPSTSVCDWNGIGEFSWNDDTYDVGVYCHDDTGLVKEILVSRSEMSGTLPTEVSLLQNLETLSLTFGSLTGSLPTQLGDLPNLQYLVLDYNLFLGTLPPKLPVSLKTISIDGNWDLFGELPRDWGNTLTNLVEFHSYECALEGTIPTEWFQLVQLEYFSLSQNYGFIGTLPTSLGLMTSLTALFLDGNRFSGSLPSEISNLDQLQTLALGYNQQLASSTIPVEWGSLNQLRWLDLEYNAHTGSIPTTIGLMTSLTGLDLSSNRLTGSLPSEIGNLDNLERLYVQENPLLAGTIPPEYANLRNLDYFYLYDTSLTGSLNSIFCERNDDPPYMDVDCSMVAQCSCCSACH